MERVSKAVNREKNVFKTTNLVRMGLLSALAVVLMKLEFVVPGFPPFLKMDISDLPAVIGAFIIGPVGGVIIQLIKVLLYTVSGSETFGIGPLANFIVGAAYIFPLGLIYKYKRNILGFVFGCVVGTITMAIVSAFMNYFVMIPFYSVAFGLSIDAIVEMCAKINSNVKDLKTLIIFSILPFNILKAVIISSVSIVLYTPLRLLFNRISNL